MDTVLVVDDDDGMRLFVSDEFSHLDYNVITAVNSEEALICFAEEAVDIVVMDLHALKTDSLEILGKIREISHVPIIIYTANPDDIAMNVYDNIKILSKFSGITELTDLVQNMLNV